MGAELSMLEESILGLLFHQEEVALNFPDYQKFGDGFGIHAGGIVAHLYLSGNSMEEATHKTEIVFGMLVQKKFISYDAPTKKYVITTAGRDLNRCLFGEPVCYGNLLNGVVCYHGFESHRLEEMDVTEFGD